MELKEFEDGLDAAECKLTFLQGPQGSSCRTLACMTAARELSRDMPHATAAQSGGEEEPHSEVDALCQSDSDSSQYRQPARFRWRPGLVVAALVAVTLGVAVWGEMHVGKRPFGSATRPDTVAASGAAAAAARHLLQAPEVESMLIDEAGEVLGNASMSTDAALRRDVDELLGHLGSLVDAHLDADVREALQGVRLDRGLLRDLKSMINAAHDGRLVALGREIVELVRNTTTASEEEISRSFVARLRPRQAELARLRDELIPTRFIRPAGRTSAAPTVDLWRGMLSPEAVSEMRKAPPPVQQSSVASQRVPAEALTAHVRDLAARVGARSGPAAAGIKAERRLPELMYASNVVNVMSGGEIALSITSIVIATGLETLFILNQCVGGGLMPLWVWIMIIVPTEASTIATCMVGFNMWCYILLGIVGTNVVTLMEQAFFFHPGDHDSSSSHYMHAPHVPLAHAYAKHPVEGIFPPPPNQHTHHVIAGSLAKNDGDFLQGLGRL